MVELREVTAAGPSPPDMGAGPSPASTLSSVAASSVAPAPSPGGGPASKVTVQERLGGSGAAASPVRIPSTGVYVSCTAGSDGNDGASGRPWRSLRRAQSHALSADTGLYLQRGCVWNEKLDVKGGGSAEAPALVSAYGSGRLPEIRGVGETGNSAVALLGDHVQLADVRIVGSAGYAIQVFGSHSLVSGVEIAQSGSGIRLMGGTASWTTCASVTSR